MLTRRLAIAACLGLLPTARALAQPLGGPALPPPAEIPPPPRLPRPPVYDDEDDGISERAAIRIARRRGVVAVDRVRRGRNVWIVAGTDEYGDDIRVIVDDEGEVVEVRRD